MILNIILIILSITSSTLITFFTGIYDIWWVDILMVLAIIPIYVALFLIYMGLLTLFSMMLSTKKPIKKVSPFFANLTSDTNRLLVLLSNVKVIKTGFDKLPKERSLYVSNHISNFDPFIMCSHIKTRPIICVTKPENIGKLLVGPLMYNAGYIPMDREDMKKQVESINRASKVIKNNEASVIIYPEGQRNFDHPDYVLPFHGGSFKIAFRSKAPIVICSIFGTNKIKNRMFIRRNIVRFDVLKVLYYDDYKDLQTNDVAKMSEDLINERLRELNK